MKKIILIFILILIACIVSINQFSDIPKNELNSKISTYNNHKTKRINYDNYIDKKPPKSTQKDEIITQDKKHDTESLYLKSNHIDISVDNKKEQFIQSDNSIEYAEPQIQIQKSDGTDEEKNFADVLLEILDDVPYWIIYDTYVRFNNYSEEQSRLLDDYENKLITEDEYIRVSNENHEQFINTLSSYFSEEEIEKLFNKSETNKK